MQPVLLLADTTVFDLILQIIEISITAFPLESILCIVLYINTDFSLAMMSATLTLLHAWKGNL